MLIFSIEVLLIMYLSIFWIFGAILGVILGLIGLIIGALVFGTIGAILGVVLGFLFGLFMWYCYIYVFRRWNASTTEAVEKS